MPAEGRCEIILSGGIMEEMDEFKYLVTIYLSMKKWRKKSLKGLPKEGMLWQFTVSRVKIW